MNSPIALRPRILLIEDAEHRRIHFREWMADSEFHLVEAHTGGQALGILQRGGTETIAGICLDHDLGDEHASGSHIAIAIQSRIPRQVPILVHSMNVTRSGWMVSTLEHGGYSVSRIRFCILDQPRFAVWLEGVRENWVG
jgi:CheY-like chemotaxis protein